MPRRELTEKNIRKLTRMGRQGKSLGLTLPIEIVKNLNWRERQKVIVKQVGKKIIIKDWPVRRSPATAGQRRKELKI